MNLPMATRTLGEALYASRAARVSLTQHRLARSAVYAPSISPTQNRCALQCHFSSQATQPGSRARRLNALSLSAPLRCRRAAPLPLRSPQLGRQSRHITGTNEQRTRLSMGPVTIFTLILFVATGVGFYYYVQYEKARVERERIAEHSKGVGKPKVGGPFELVDQDGREWKSTEKMDGKYSLIYFGFSHCPDICPEELDKMAVMLDIVAQKVPASIPKNPQLLPVFITCDPARDSPAVLKAYLAEFHPNIVGLTGTWEQIKALCRLYRVYFSTPPGVKPGQDYLVDHSIYFYLMDPDGDFVEAIGRQHAAEKGAQIIVDHMKDWKGKIVKS